jgi:hypothetical protein
MEHSPKPSRNDRAGPAAVPERAVFGPTPLTPAHARPELPPMETRRAVTWHSDRTVSVGFLGAQFCVCVGSWLVVVLLIEGTASTSGLVASIVTGVVLMIVSWISIKVGWDIGPSKSATTSAVEPGA